MILPQAARKMIVAAETRDFRRRATEIVTPDDFFLEIGCSFGECTKLLAEQGCRGIALDNSSEAVAVAGRAMLGYPNITVVQMDARDMADIHALCSEPSVILFDVGGSESLDKVISLLRLALKTFRPRLLLVRSMELAELSSLVQEVHLPDRPHLLASLEDNGVHYQLIDLSRSPVVKDRLYAIQRFRRLIERPAVVARLEEMTRDDSPSVCKQARHALAGRQGSSKKEP